MLHRLKEIRESRFLTQAELAERAGMSRVAITRLEGGTPARLTTTRKLAEVLGVEPGELLGEQTKAAADSGSNGAETA